MEQRRQRKRALAILLALVAAAGLVVASVTNRWLTSPDYGDAVAMGLLDLRTCDDGCKTISLFQLVDELELEIERIKEENKTLPLKEQRAIPRSPWHGFPAMGVSTMVLALIAAAGLLLGAVLALVRKRVAWPIMPTTIGVLGLALGIVTACIFVATKPDADQLMGVGWSFMTFGGAAVVGLASVFPLNRQIRPIDEELGAASATMTWGGSRDDLP